MTPTQRSNSEDFKISGGWEEVTKRLQQKFWQNLERKLSTESVIESKESSQIPSSHSLLSTNKLCSNENKS